MIYFDFPRPCRLNRFGWLTPVIRLAGQLIPSQALANNLFHHDVEAVAVVHLAIVAAENLFVKITKQVKRFDRNICALQAALYQTPEILHPVSVDFTAHVFNGVVYHSVLELVQTFIRIEGIG